MRHVPSHSSIWFMLFTQSNTASGGMPGKDICTAATTRVCRMSRRERSWRRKQTRATRGHTCATEILPPFSVSFMNTSISRVRSVSTLFQLQCAHGRVGTAREWHIKGREMQSSRGHTYAGSPATADSCAIRMYASSSTMSGNPRSVMPQPDKPTNGTPA